MGIREFLRGKRSGKLHILNKNFNSDPSENLFVFSFSYFYDCKWKAISDSYYF